MRLELVRYCYSPEQVLGLLKVDVKEDGTFAQSLWTVECPWQHNARFVSCVPDGAYRLGPHDSIKHPGTYRLTEGGGLTDRSGILIHVGNMVTDTTGCICPGITRHDMAVLQSADALRVLNDVLGRTEIHHLIIGPGLGARLIEGEKGRAPEDTPTPAANDDGANGDGLLDDLPPAG